MIALGGLAIACSEKQVFQIEGVVRNAEKSTLYLENIGVSVVTVLDSVKLKADGKFSFVQPRPAIPDFYRLRTGDRWINLAIDSTEKITVHADAASGYAQAYTVEGSEDAGKIKVLTLLQMQAADAYGKAREAQKQNRLSQEACLSEIQKAIQPYRDAARKYVYENPSSTAAYFALFQQIDNLLILDPYSREDNRLYAAVATGWDLKYGNHPRARQLHDIAIASMKEIRRQKAQNDISGLEVKEAIAWFEISLPDVRGATVSLSDVIREGKVILLDFTACQAKFSPEHNMDLGGLYEKYHDEGLEIFQVSLDADLNFWQNASLNVPWICVRDPETVYSRAAAAYNVRELPATFLLNRKGEVVRRLEQGMNPDAEIRNLL
jgi:peroxiredoxin